MNPTLRAVFAIFVALLTLSLLVGAGVALFHALVGIAVVCVMIAAISGIMVYNDYKFFFGKKATTSVAPPPPPTK